MRYIPTTDSEKQEMLNSIGITSVNELFKSIPREMQLKGPLPLPPAIKESELIRHMDNLAKKNTSLSEMTSFLGAGIYDHLIPSVIHHIVNRGEFLTAYTPYQAEISQGVLQAIFEYQTLIAELTGMEAANASMYDGATALAEAALLACNVTRRNVVMIPTNLHPEWQEVVELYLHSQDISVKKISYCQQTGCLDIEELEKHITKDVACLIMQQPNFFGVLEQGQQLADVVHKIGGLLLAAVDPISLGLLKPPGEYNADIVVGEGQSLGNHMNYGGPGFGFFATTAKLIRRMPGRIVGETIDYDKKRGYVLTLQTREQHIRREKATSNICTNQALNALAAAVYLSVIGKQGLKDVAYLCLQKAAYLHSKLAQEGYTPKFSSPFFKEFVVQADNDWIEINKQLANKGFLGGLPLKPICPSLGDSVLLAVTEARTKEEIDTFVEVLRGMT